jgi:hypothetical protein
MSKNRVAAKTVMTILALALLSSAGALVSPLAYADEGGASFWLPGQYGSLAAVPAEPGWSLPLIYYHSSTDAGGSKDFAIGGRITAGLIDGGPWLAGYKNHQDREVRNVPVDATACERKGDYHALPII